MTHPTDSEDQAYQIAYRRARHQVKKMRGWYIHALVFAAVVGFAWLRYWFGDTYVGWTGLHRIPRMPLGMTLGWGLALTIHGVIVFGRSAGFGPFSREWEEKQLEKLMADQAKPNGDPGKW